MKLRVAAAALTLTALASLAGGGAAMADDDHPLPGPSAGGAFPPHHPHSEENELHDRYGDDVGQVNLPPLAVKDQSKTGTAAIPAKNNTVTPIEGTKLVDAGKADPKANLPIDPTSIDPNQGTPADVFFNAATFGLGAMGLGVIALVVLAIRRRINVSKDPKSDFLYQ